MIEEKLSNDQDYPDNSVVLDWKASPHTVMEELESVLAGFGLEIVSYDTHSDSYCFAIRKKETKKEAPKCTECNEVYEPAGHADVRCKNCGNHQTPNLADDEEEELFCIKCGKCIGVYEHDTNGGMCATCFGERNA